MLRWHTCTVEIAFKCWFQTESALHAGVQPVGSTPSAASTEFYSWQDLRLGSALQVWHCHWHIRALWDSSSQTSACNPQHSQRYHSASQMCSCTARSASLLEGLLTPHMCGMIQDRADLLL